MKETTTIAFPSMENLWAFKINVKAGFFELDVSGKLLSTELTKDEINLAISKYDARVIDRTILSNITS